MWLHVEIAILDCEHIVPHRGTNLRAVIGQHKVGHLDVAGFTTDVQPLLFSVTNEL